MYEKLAIEKKLGTEALYHAKNGLGFEYKRFNLGVEQRLSMITIEIIGQMVFKDFLEKSSVKFDYQLQYGKFYNYDFKIADRIVDIKSSGYKNSDDWLKLNAVYNVSQLQQAILKKYFCTVQIFLNGYDKVNKLFNVSKCDTAIIAGWLEIDQIASIDTKYFPHGRAHLIPLAKLKPIKTLFNL